MARNVRINLTVDERVDEVVGRYAELTGTTKSGAIAAWLVRVLPSMRQEVMSYERSESAYQRAGARPLSTAVGREDELDRQDEMRQIHEKAVAKASASEAEGGDDDEGSNEPLTRQQRRALERQEQKAARRQRA